MLGLEGWGHWGTGRTGTGDTKNAVGLGLGDWGRKGHSVWDWEHKVGVLGALGLEGWEH